MTTTEDIKEKIKALLATILSTTSFELVELNIHRSTRSTIIQVFADKPNGGITLDECSMINRKLSEKLEEENFILGRYIVEVSSPGLDRPLKTVKDFLKVMGREVRFHLLEPIENKIEHSGKIKEVHDDEVIIESKLQTITIPFRIIQKAVQIIL